METRPMNDQPIEEPARALYDIVYTAVCDALRADSLDIQRGLQRQALRETVDFVAANLPLYLGYPTRLALLERAIELAPAKGLVLEFGVYKGRSINLIASRMPERTIYGFDSFAGSPEPWLYRRHAFGDVEGLPPVRENCVLVKGCFAETLPRFLKRSGEPCAFIHIDSDLYSSAKVILEHLEDRIVAETVILFDEFFNYPGWKNGEHRAFHEFVARTGVEFKYIGFTYRAVREERRLKEGGSGYQVAVQILTTPAATAAVIAAAERLTPMHVQP